MTTTDFSPAASFATPLKFLARPVMSLAWVGLLALLIGLAWLELELARACLEVALSVA